MADFQLLLSPLVTNRQQTVYADPAPAAKEPIKERDLDPVLGPFACTIDDASAILELTARVMLPTALGLEVTPISIHCLSPLKQLCFIFNVEDDVHTVASDAVPPTRILLVTSADIPRLPTTVKDVDPVAGKLLEQTTDKLGWLTLMTFFSVPAPPPTVTTTCFLLSC